MLKKWAAGIPWIINTQTVGGFPTRTTNQLCLAVAAELTPCTITCSAESCLQLLVRLPGRVTHHTVNPGFRRSKIGSEVAIICSNIPITAGGISVRVNILNTDLCLIRSTESSPDTGCCYNKHMWLFWWGEITDLHESLFLLHMSHYRPVCNSAVS